MVLLRAKITIDNLDIDCFLNSNGDYFFSQTSLEALTENGERDIRDFLKGKSPEALRCKGLTTGKIEKIAETRNSIKPVPLIIVENYLLYHAFRGNTNAKTVVSWFSGLGLYTRCHTAFGNDVTVQKVNLWSEARECMKEDFQPLLSAWNKRDSEPIPYAGFIQNFKRAAKVPLKNPEDMTSSELKRYDDMIKRYDLLRLIGLSDKEARSKISSLY
jgi:hypothetical protein